MAAVSKDAIVLTHASADLRGDREVVMTEISEDAKEQVLQYLVVNYKRYKNSYKIKFNGFL